MWSLRVSSPVVQVDTWPLSQIGGPQDQMWMTVKWGEQAGGQTEPALVGWRRGKPQRDGDDNDKPTALSEPLGSHLLPGFLPQSSQLDTTAVPPLHVGHCCSEEVFGRRAVAGTQLRAGVQLSLPAGLQAQENGKDGTGWTSGSRVAGRAGPAGQGMLHCGCPGRGWAGKQGDHLPVLAVAGNCTEV